MSDFPAEYNPAVEDERDEAERGPVILGLPVKSLGLMEAEVYDNNVGHGWFDSDRTFGDGIALIHSELSEALDAFRAGGLADQTKNGGKPYTPTDHDAYEMLPKPEGVGSEFADVLIRLLDECHRGGIDLEAEYERKMAYNRTRPYRHGDKAL